MNGSFCRGFTIEENGVQCDLPTTFFKVGKQARIEKMATSLEEKRGIRVGEAAEPTSSGCPEGHCRHIAQNIR